MTVCHLLIKHDVSASGFVFNHQGMDESNERLVFDRIVKSCCGDRSKPQYFLGE